MKPKLSVVVPSYNHQDYISETLKSLEKQTFQNFEIIVVDDGSTDRTVEAVKSFPSRARIFTQEHQGVVAARNRGVSLARGEYICFVDSDDVILSDRFEKQVAVLDSDLEVGLVFADALIIDSKGEQIGKFSDVYPVVPGDVAEMLVLHYCFTPMITVMVRTEVLRKTGPFEKPGPISDYIKWIEVAHLSKVYYDPKPLGCWRRHQRSTSKNVRQEKKYVQTRMMLRRILRKYPRLKAKVGKNIVKRFSRSYFLTGFFLAADGNIKRAKKYYIKAAKVYPWSVENWGGVLLISLPMNKVIQKIHQYVKTKKLPW